MRRFQWWLGVAVLLVGVTFGPAADAVAQEGPGTD
jgi:hypothetical protein